MGKKDSEREGGISKLMCTSRNLLTDLVSISGKCYCYSVVVVIITSVSERLREGRWYI